MKFVTTLIAPLLMFAQVAPVYARGIRSDGEPARVIAQQEARASTKTITGKILMDADENFTLKDERTGRVYNLTSTEKIREAIESGNSSVTVSGRVAGSDMSVESVTTN